mgnify:CR=1 FL=1
MESYIRVIVQIVAIGIWSVIGFIFWIPLLFRVTAVFSGSILIYAVNNQDTSPLRAYLDAAIGFYDRGFKIINSTFSKNYSRGPQSYVEPISLYRLALELITTFVFWGAMASVVYFR